LRLDMVKYAWAAGNGRLCYILMFEERPPRVCGRTLAPAKGNGVVAYNYSVHLNFPPVEGWHGVSRDGVVVTPVQSPVISSGRSDVMRSYNGVLPQINFICIFTARPAVFLFTIKLSLMVARTRVLCYYVVREIINSRLNSGRFL
jgi:hypothetical protein